MNSVHQIFSRGLQTAMNQQYISALPAGRFSEKLTCCVLSGSMTSGFLLKGPDRTFLKKDERIVYYISVHNQINIGENMSGKSDPGDQWRQTSVVIRSDIYSKAVEMGLDISDELNQRLAGRLGIEYRHEQLVDRPLTQSIVGAAD